MHTGESKGLGGYLVLSIGYWYRRLLFECKVREYFESKDCTTFIHVREVLFLVLVWFGLVW